MTSKPCLIAMIAAVLAAGCSPILGIKDPTLDEPAPDDARLDDARLDDARLDDAKPDGPGIDAIQSSCAPGPCCSASGLEPSTTACGPATTEFQCAGTCGGHPQQRTVQQHCSGTSSACDGAIVTGTFMDISTPCSASEICETQLSAAPRCSTCQFGCDSSASACRAGKLWVFPTIGQFQGNGFGGAGGTPTVRATSDALCFDTFSQRFATRQCNRTRTHAVLFVDTSDSLGLMASLYSIPTTVPVHRADDDVLVENNWNDLINTNLVPREKITTAPTSAEGIVWSGANATSHCNNWRSLPGSGAQGDTTLLVPNWLMRFSGACDTLAHLLCVCWSGGQ